MKTITLCIMILSSLLNGLFADEILDVKITKIEKVDKRIDFLSEHDFNVYFLYDNMDCNARMSFNFKKTHISSDAFFCNNIDNTRLYSEFPLMNKKHEYIIINKETGTKIIDLNSIDKSKLSIQKKLVK